MIIAFTGAQSTGKTTLLRELKKIPELDQNFTFVESFVRGLKKRQDVAGKSGDAVQQAVLQAHIDNLQGDNRILDRCLLDGVVYTRYYAGQGAVSVKMVREAYKMLKQYKDKYDLIFYLRPEFGVVVDGERPSSPQCQKEVSSLFDKMIKYMPNVTLLTGSIEERVQTILAVLKEKNIL